MLTMKNAQKKTPLHLAIDKGDVRSAGITIILLHFVGQIALYSTVHQLVSSLNGSILNALQERREERDREAATSDDFRLQQLEAVEKKEWHKFWNSESPKLLNYACLHGTVETVKYFISKGVSPTTMYVHNWM